MSFGRAIQRAVLFCSTVLLFSTTLTKIAAQTPLLSVRVDRPLGSINPYVYGMNYGNWNMISPDMVPAAQAAKITYLRFPAGNWGDDNDLRPLDIDLFMIFSRQMNAEPSISVRLKNGTPEAAVKLVQYVNIEKKYGVKYWSIGNEPDLFPNYSIEQYVSDWRKFAEAMRAVDPTIRFVGPDISKFPPPTDIRSSRYYPWLKAFLKANGDMVDIVSVHHYPFPLVKDGHVTTIEELKNSAPEWDMMIPTMRQFIKEEVGHDLPVAITEVNSHWNHSSEGPATPDSFYNAIWWADVLGRLIRQRVDLVTYFVLVSTPEAGPVGILSRFGTRPTYYTYQIYQHLGTELVESESSDKELTITAALTKDGKLTLLIVNPSQEPRTAGIAISEFKGSLTADSYWLLDPNHPKVEQIKEKVDLSSGELAFPAQSVSAFELDASRP
jgi:hypothetical protein